MSFVYLHGHTVETICNGIIRMFGSTSVHSIMHSIYFPFLDPFLPSFRSLCIPPFSDPNFWWIIIAPLFEKFQIFLFSKYSKYYFLNQFNPAFVFTGFKNLNFVISCKNQFIRNFIDRSDFFFGLIKIVNFHNFL